jgi:hypothetical protein
MVEALEFVWWKDSGGFQIAPAEAPVRPDTVSLLAGAGRAERLVRVGGDLVAYRPLFRFDTVFKQFAKVRDSAMLLDFANKFGPLTRDGLDNGFGEDVAPLLVAADTMRLVVEAHGRRDGPELRRLLTPGLPITTRSAAVDVVLTLPRRGVTPMLQYRTPDLLRALWLQAALRMAGGRALTPCKHCGKLFEAGVGTKRRLGALFCTHAHQRTYNSLQRSKKD